jgi:hypothetical protein
LIEKGSKAKLNADLIAQASADAAIEGLVAYPPDLFAPLEVGAEPQAVGEDEAVSAASNKLGSAPSSQMGASGLDLVVIRRELRAALDLLNFDREP